jgi:quinol monooxygenase YgiN
MKQLTVLAKVKAREGKEEDVKKELLTLVDLTRSESGCVSYDLHKSKNDNRLFMFYENWTSTEDFDNHLNMPHLKDFIKRTENMLAEPIEVTLWELMS